MVQLLPASTLPVQPLLASVNVPLTEGKLSLYPVKLVLDVAVMTQSKDLVEPADATTPGVFDVTEMVASPVPGVVLLACVLLLPSPHPASILMAIGVNIKNFNVFFMWLYRLALIDLIVL